jgi:hypothetical protein
MKEKEKAEVYAGIFKVIDDAYYASMREYNGNYIDFVELEAVRRFKNCILINIGKEVFDKIKHTN